MSNSNVHILSLQGKTSTTHPNNSQSESPCFKHSTGCNEQKISFRFISSTSYYFTRFTKMKWHEWANPVFFLLHMSACGSVSSPPTLPPQNVTCMHKLRCVLLKLNFCVLLIRQHQLTAASLSNTTTTCLPLVPISACSPGASHQVLWFLPCAERQRGKLSAV